MKKPKQQWLRGWMREKVRAGEVPGWVFDCLDGEIPGEIPAPDTYLVNRGGWEVDALWGKDRSQHMRATWSGPKKRLLTRTVVQIPHVVVSKTVPRRPRIQLGVAVRGRDLVALLRRLGVTA